MDERELADDPIEQLGAWLDAARATVPLPEAMTLATADGRGSPSARVVLLRGLDERGLVFFTNRDSRKGEDLGSNPRVAAVFHWWQLGRQVRVEGVAEHTTEAETEAYWGTRPRASRIAAWASPQSKPLSSRAELEALMAEQRARFGDGEIPLPSFWGGYRIVPDAFEFWVHRDDRLHDRVRYLRSGGGWRRERLAP